MDDIKRIFTEECKFLIIDTKLLSKLKRFESEFVNKNEHHINFFGGVLMGVNPVRFTADDRLRWFNEIFSIDESTLMRALYKSPSINQSWIVSSDVMNLSCFYLMHRFLNEKTLSAAQREEGAYYVALIMNYKFFTSILTGWFTYNANPTVAETTYALLTKKFGLKMVGSWGALIQLRSKDIVKVGGLHRKLLEEGSPDKKVVEMLNDVWGRVKSILKYIRNMFTVAQNMPEYQIQTTSNTIVLDGEVRLRDQTKVVSQQTTYILNALQDRYSFIKQDILNVVLQFMGNAPTRNINDVLLYMVNNASIRADKDVEEFVKTVVEHSVNYLIRNPGFMRNKTDLANLLRRMHGLYTSAKTEDPYIVRIRELGDRIAGKGGNTKNKQVITVLRTTIALYVVLRVNVMNYYK